METIFKTDKNGKQRYFDISVEKMPDGTANIIKKTGMVGGKEQVSTIHVKLGYESALKRAKTMWENQKEIPILPMLANKWEDRHKYITEPFYVQPKIDGVRLLVSNKGGISRTGKVVPGTGHLGKGLKEGEYLDGECYDPTKTFEEITSLFKTNPKALEFHVFDYFDTNRPNLTFDERLERVNVETRWVKTKSDLPVVHKQYMDAGYEGTMIREASSVYEIGKRSNYLLKLKDFKTDEYKVIGMRECAGKDVGTPIWVCTTENGQEFTVRPEGTQEKRRDMFKNGDRYIGKMLTVKYQNLTDLGVPRFPVGIVFRDYE
jgi:ATP-dependent DNA ligase